MFTDHVYWALSIELAAESRHDDLGAPFQQALQSEAEHLVMIKKWLRETVFGEAA